MAAIRAVEQLDAAHLWPLNSATMILLPKREDAAGKRDFRPICLVDSFAKLFAKILARRLRCKMDALVRPCQNAFIKDRSIHDNYIYVRGIARALRQTKTPAMMIKLDLEKAFDTVSWEFLLEVLQAKGFGRKWSNWISNLLATQSTRVLVNGGLSEPIIHRTGLRQGDPLSPLLFVIVLDCMAAMFATSSQVGILKPIGNQRLAYRTSLYADDAIIFINPDVQEMKAVHDMLDAFGMASGLRTNYGKSSITPICCGELDMEAIAGELGCPIKHFPCTYLGMPLSDSRITRTDWQPALDKVYGKMKGWKLAHFSMDTRLSLVQQVLSAMLVFQMIAIDPPVWLRKAVDKVRRGFLWESKEVASGGKCLVNWRGVCRPRELGGLGITSIEAQSTALRMRWLWQAWTEPEKPWLGLPLPTDERVRALFNASVHFHLGNGKKISFWREPWLLSASLNVCFPELYKHCTRKKLTVAEAIGDARWTRHIKENPSDQAIREFTTLWVQLQQVVLRDEPDWVEWKWTADRRFTSASAYAIQFEGVNTD